MATNSEKQDIERSIDRARDGVSERIDELDRRLRASMNIRAVASRHAPQIIAGGAVIGFLAGFGFPKALRRAIGIATPLALAVLKFRRSRKNADDGDFEYEVE